MKCSAERPRRSSTAIARREEIRAELRARFPTLAGRCGILPATEQSSIVLGRGDSGDYLHLPERARLEHCFVVGTTGGGKSKCLEACIRQDIAAGRGVLVIDPHGEHPDSLYRSVLSWMHVRGHADRPTLHLIDPSAPTHTVGFNPLARPDAKTDLSVIAGVALEAFSRAWGDEEMSRKPTIERVLTTTFATLAELGLSLVEAPLLLDRLDRHGLRAHALATITDEYCRIELQRLHELSQDERRRQDFDMEVIGPVNRLARFLRPASIRHMLGQTDNLLDLREALDEGHVILCNLSGSAHIYEADADLLGRLLTRFAFFHAKRRLHPERSFFVYMDECHRYLSGDLENILAESRKYGLGTILATQWLQQLRKDSENMLAAVLNATNVKIVFRAKDPAEAEQLAEMVVPLDLEIPVQSLIKPTVVGHRRTTLTSESATEQDSVTRSTAETWAETESASWSCGGSQSVGNSTSNGTSESDVDGYGYGTAEASFVGSADSMSTAQMLDPSFSFFPPNVIGLTRGWNSADSSGTTHGSSESRNRQHATGTSTTASRSALSGTAWSESYAEATQYAVTKGSSGTRGRSQSRGSSEAFEAIFANLPTAVHSRDNVRYLAAHSVRCLPTGFAFVNYVGPAGMVAARIKVPVVANRAVSPAEFDRIRVDTLMRSSCAIPAPRGADVIKQRARAFLAIAAPTDEPEPATFRTKAPSAAKERDCTPPDASVRARPRRSPNSKKHVE